ncbi:hypothetical protein X777_12496 [Ooceraea biroi]|uniref:Uncharacterized protein n=1 Tax=Ooceraea biroi TaxID=2015173 RepID=A0A026VZC5_OOCBI|nr:hypothetical protein X777_12496 [Ooceraea biroi]
MVDVHHLGAEKSGSTKPGQRRVSGYATIWGAKLVATAMWRLNGDWRRKTGQEEGVGRRRATSTVLKRSLQGRRMRRKAGDRQRGLHRPHSRRMRVFKHTWPA